MIGLLDSHWYRPGDECRCNLNLVRRQCPIHLHAEDDTARARHPIDLLTLG